MLSYLNAILAFLVLVSVICRLTMIPLAKPGHFTAWNFWIGAHALIGAGCIGFIAGAADGRLPSLAPTLTYLGLAIMLLVRWKRREGDA